MKDYKKDYNSLLNKIRKVYLKERSINLSSSFLNFLSIIILSTFIVLSIEIFAHGDTSIRKVLISILILSILGSFWFYLKKDLFAFFKISFDSYYLSLTLKIGNAFPEIKDRLTNALQLVPIIERSSNSENDLAYVAFQEAYEVSKNKDFESIIDKSKFKKSLILFLTSIVITSSIFFVANKAYSDSANRLINYNTEYLPPVPFEINIQNKARNVLRGDDVKITINGKGELPQTIQLFLKEGEQETFNPYKIILNEDSTYSYEIKSIKNDIEFYAEAKYLKSVVSTDLGRIAIITRPMVKSFNGVVKKPSYTNSSNELINEKNGDISSLKGSIVSFDLNSNKELESAYLIFSDEISSTISEVDTTKLEIDNNTAKCSIKISKSGSYYFSIKDTNGEFNIEPISYRVIALDDEYPSIDLIEPKQDVQVKEDALLPIQVEIIDDYGLSKLILNYKLTFSKYTPADPDFSQLEIPIVSNENDIKVPYIWDINEVGISPQDEYEFYLEVFDNDVVSGPKSARTRILKLRLPSLDEVYAKAEEEQKEVEKELEEALKEAEELKKEMEDLQHDLRQNFKKKKLDWEEKKRAKDINEKQEKVREKMQELSQKLEESTQKLDQNKALSEETLKKYMELQDLMKQVATPEMMKRSQQINKKLEEMSPKELQAIMKEQQMNEEQFLKNIERTMKMLKKLQTEQKIDEVSKKAKQMEKEQEKLKEQTKNSDNLSKKEKQELAKKQEMMKEKLADLEKEMQELMDKMKELDDKNLMKDFEKALEKLNSNETKEQIQQAQENIQQNQQQKAQENQQEIQKNLQEFANQMQQMKQQMMQNQMQKAMDGLQKAANSLAELSKQQEELMKETQNLNPNSTRLPQMQKQQNDIQNSLNQVARDLMELSEKSFAVTPQMGKDIGESMKSMQQANSELSERRTNSASKKQQSAMSGMNQAASSMSAMMEQLSQMQGQGKGSGGQGGMGQGQGQGQSGGNTGFSQQLSQAAAQQQMIRNSLQQMMQGQGQGQQGKSKGKGSGDGGSGQGKSRDQYGRIKKEVGKASKSIGEMNDEFKKFNPENKRVQKELSDIQKDLQEVLRDIESGNINEETLKRQEKILSRLLDAQKSVNKRDFQKKRKAISGKNYKAESPSDIDFENDELRKQALEEMLDKLKQGYSKDYEKLIRKYYESVKEDETTLPE